MIPEVVGPSVNLILLVYVLGGVSIITQSEPPNPNTSTGVSRVVLAPTNISPDIEKVLVGKDDIVDLPQSVMNRVLRYAT